MKKLCDPDVEESNFRVKSLYCEFMVVGQILVVLGVVLYNFEVNK